jgi:hypothetical protein
VLRLSQTRRLLAAGRERKSNRPPPSGRYRTLRLAVSVVSFHRPLDRLTAPARPRLREPQAIGGAAWGFSMPSSYAPQ